MNYKNSLYFSLVITGLILFSSCANDPESTGYSFLYDMRHSQAYETYSANPNFDDGRTARLPVPGTIARGTLYDKDLEEAYHLSYRYKEYFKDTPDDYERAGATLKNPIELNDQVLKEGKALYTIKCQVCHDAKGEGKGTIVETGAYPPVPDYKISLKDKQVGKLFHSITYGRNLMGAYSSQTTVEERWKLIYYIQKLAGMGEFEAEVATEDANKDAEAATAN